MFCAHGQRRKQRALLKQHAPAPLDAAALGRARRVEVDAEHLDAAGDASGTRPMMVRVSTDLPAPDGPTKPEDLAALDVEVEASSSTRV